MALAAKATIDVMASIFQASGRCVAISVTPSDGTGTRRVAPILDIPSAMSARPGDAIDDKTAPAGEKAPPSHERIILCYFLTQAPARRLERLVHRHPVPGVTFHVFSSEPLALPRGRAALSVVSHRKQRKLFQDLFATCEGVICSTGNETVWEAVCRGVPVLTIPTAGHGEQILNATVHARALPALVRTRGRLKLADVQWVAGTQPGSTEQARAESLALRTSCQALHAPGGVAEALSLDASSTSAESRARA